MASAQDAQSNVTIYGYDAAGRRTSAVDAANEHGQYGYDNADNLTGITLGDGVTTVSSVARTYDALNRLASQTISGPSTSPLTTTFSYDLGGNLVREQQPGNDVTFHGYDLASQLVSQELDAGTPNLPSGTHSESFSYDAAGNRMGSTDFRGGTTQMTLDGDNRQTAQLDSYTGTTPISDTAGFDPDGNLVSQQETIGSQSHTFGSTYNPADWPQSATNDSLTTTASGSGSGDLSAQTLLNGGGSVTYNLDAAGRTNAIGVSAGGTGPLTTTLTLNNNSLLTNLTQPTSVQQNATYDGANRLTQLTAQNTTNPSLLNSTYQYGYNAVGWTTTITSTTLGGNSTQQLTHDALGRLTAATGTGPTGSWSYEGDGNLTSATVNGVTNTYSYDPTNPHELTSLTTTDQPTSYYHYDGNGATTSITNTASLNTQLSYDAQARLVQVTLGSPVTSTIALAYNAFGERASYSVTPAGAGQPSLAEQFSYRDGELA